MNQFHQKHSFASKLKQYTFLDFVGFARCWDDLKGLYCNKWWRVIEPSCKYLQHYCYEKQFSSAREKLDTIKKNYGDTSKMCSVNSRINHHCNLGKPSKKKTSKLWTLSKPWGGEVWARTNFFPIWMFGHIFNGEGGQNPLSKVVFEKKFDFLLL